MSKEVFDTIMNNFNLLAESVISIFDSEFNLISTNLSDPSISHLFNKADIYLEKISQTGEHEFEFTEKTIINDEPCFLIHKIKPIYYDNILKQYIVIIAEKRDLPSTSINLLWRSIEQSPTIVIITDKESNILYVNPKFSQLTGYQLNEVVGKNSNILRGDATVDGLYQDLWSTILKGNVWKGEFKNKKKDGSPFWVSATISAVTDFENKITHFIGIQEDITEKIKLETRNKALQDKIRRLEKLDVMGSLSARIAHDFNNILSAIKGNVDILKFVIDDNKSEIIEIIDQMELAVDRAERIIAQLRIFSSSKIDRKGIIETSKLYTAAKEYMMQHAPQDTHFEIINNTSIKAIKGDLSLIQTLFSNIVKNCIDAKATKIEILVNDCILSEEKVKSMEFDISAGEYIKLEIIDDGIGMSEDAKNHMFEPFYSTKLDKKGKGLGLSTIYGTMINHDGAVEVFSSQNEGTRVITYFPIDSELIKETSTEIDQTVGFSIDSDTVVLVIDDDPLISNYIARMLSQLNCKYLVYNDPLDALAFYRDNWDNIDLVITDFNMPKMDGWAVVDAVSQINKSIKVILMTGFLSDIEEKYLDFVKILEKPVNRHDLVSCISSQLKS
jgi:PAS domain S-box-containing protein